MKKCPVCLEDVTELISYCGLEMCIECRDEEQLRTEIEREELEESLKYDDFDQDKE